MTLLLPLYRALQDGRDSYLLNSELQHLAPLASRSWRLHNRVRSAQYRGGYIKLLTAFADHAQDEASFLGLMDHCYTRGVTRPSSYGSMFHALYRSPSIKWSFNAPFLDWFVGGWEEARFTGEIYDTLYRYDINGAYLWSLTRGLPDPMTYRYSDKPKYGEEVGFITNGIYLVELEHSLCHLPYPFNTDRLFYVATTDEIEAYQLPIKRYCFGVSWESTISTSLMVDLILSFPCAKQIGRAFWGRWASAAKVECCTRARTWSIRNPVLNVIWAHMILSRVKLKIWREIREPKHIYVDEVIVDRPITTGSNIGDWRLDATFDKGLSIHGPGVYGEPGGPLIRHIGVGRN